MKWRKSANTVQSVCVEVTWAKMGQIFTAHRVRPGDEGIMNISTGADSRILVCITKFICTPTASVALAVDRL